MILLDTNVVSELARARPNPIVARWFCDQSLPELYLAAPTQAEILYGLAIMPIGKRLDELTRHLGGLIEQSFPGRILPFDGNAAEAFAAIVAGRRRLGRPIAIFDAQIAAIARIHGATVATRDVADFSDCGVPLINPWTA